MEKTCTGEIEMIETTDLNFLLVEANFYGIDGLIDKIQQAKIIREKVQKQKSSQILFEIQGMIIPGSNTSLLNVLIGTGRISNTRQYVIQCSTNLGL